MKVVINKCFGGFGLSYAAVMRYAELTGVPLRAEISEIAARVYAEHGKILTITDPEAIPTYYRTDIADRDDAYFSVYRIKRDDPMLVQTVEELGEAADDRYAELTIVEIPDGVDYEISEYDGREHIAETHRTWG